MDTEATDLNPHTREIWEVGLIIREPGCPDRERVIIVVDADFTFANVMSLDIGRAYERHPKFTGKTETGEGAPEYLSQAEAAAVIEAETRKATIVGMVPNFDTANFEVLLNRHGLPFSGHYHLVDVETLIVGYLRGQLSAGRDVPDPGQPRWKSDDLSRLVGVEPPGDQDRHTALGDARWTRDLWDVVMRDELTS
jgi:hypothetical protein